MAGLLAPVEVAASLRCAPRGLQPAGSGLRRGAAGLAAGGGP